MALFREDFEKSPINQVAMNAVVHGGLQETAKRVEAIRQDQHQFSIFLDQHGSTFQRQTGRCWMFAALNCLRFRVIHSLDLGDFELSPNYTYFYDKLEKANHFLENILDTLDEDVHGRLVAHLLQSPLQDGGQWDMICCLIEKYGVVPKSAMPECQQTLSSKNMILILTEKLREFACRLRTGYQQGKSVEELREEKFSMMNTFYRMLCICLGEPPAEFDFEARSKSGEFICARKITPQEFYQKFVGVDLRQYISLIHAPTADKPYMRSYGVKFLGNVQEGRPIRYVNVEIEILKRAAIAQMRDGEPVWFGCDVGKSSNREAGIMDTELYDYPTLFGTEFSMTKAERLDYGHSRMTHAMVFQGVDLDQDGKPLRWRVENTWGESCGEKGYFVMSDSWFDQHMYQVVVNRKYLPEDVIKAYESEPIMLDPWDPMGSLA